MLKTPSGVFSIPIEPLAIYKSANKILVPDRLGPNPTECPLADTAPLFSACVFIEAGTNFGLGLVS